MNQMDKQHVKRVKSVIPIYAMGGVFLLYALIFPMYRVWDPIVALGISVLGYILFNKFFSGTEVEIEIVYGTTGDKEVDQILTQGREYIKQLDQLKESIQDEDIGRRIVHMQNVSKQIFDHIAKNPTKIRRINTFMDYYFPTAIKFLDHYAEYGGNVNIDNSGNDTNSESKIKGENLRSTLEKISSSLARFEEAFAHQLDNLYSDKALDIETDIAVLESIMKQEGL